ncbi:hypothetical protein AcW1_002373 [Taiwanofungus camphoratus]|nr:hypothetical protein AcV5_010379 [Antrodia cinnamomea]KAI0937954.1 hypothetical protein AcV7_003283 [Antrodia cinnamomea]KAI0944735.1 hypothetical protein AcW1_002373 [Antrodia cinnamomea]
MHKLLSLIPTSVLSLLLAWCLVPLAKANYFIITEPTTGVQWANGQSNLVSWSKGLLDGIDTFDIELQRLSVDGLSYIAQGVPSSLNALNLYIQGVPTADDYYLMFLNSTHGILYTSSAAFAIANSSNSSSPTPVASAPTITLSGGPNPTDAFATTFPPSANGVSVPGWRAIEGCTLQLFGVFGAMVMCLLGGALTLL